VQLRPSCEQPLMRSTRRRDGRGDPLQGRPSRRLRVRSTSRERADDYTTTAYRPHFGGPVVYVATVAAPAVLDLRVDPSVGLAEVGVDVDDYPYLPLHELLREVATVIRASEHEWVAFVDDNIEVQSLGDGPTAVRRAAPSWPALGVFPYDEWLYLGSTPVLVEPALTSR
jgi:hypothetical protein